jgi:hypothetical protein
MFDFTADSFDVWAVVHLETCQDAECFCKLPDLLAEND